MTQAHPPSRGRRLGKREALGGAGWEGGDLFLLMGTQRFEGHLLTWHPRWRTQEFARRTLSSAAAGVVFSIVVSASALGALNANTFATARLCVAAAHRGYFPAVLANLHCRSEADEADCLEEALVRLKRPGFSFLKTGVIWFAEATRELRWRKGVPV